MPGISAVVCSLVLSAATRAEARRSCRDTIEADCAHKRDAEQMICKEEKDAQCDIEEAEVFVGRREILNAVDRLAAASRKYRGLVDVTDRDEIQRFETILIHYTIVTERVAKPLTLNGDVKELRQVVEHLQAGVEFFESVIDRIPTLAANPQVQQARASLVGKLVAAYDILGTRELRAAKATPPGLSGTAKDLYAESARHFRAARELRPDVGVFLTSEVQARFAKGALHLSLARPFRDAELAEACDEYSLAAAQMAVFRGAHPQAWQQTKLAARQKEADHAVRSCRPYRALGVSAAVVGGVGAGALLTSATLYGLYGVACDFDGQYCAGIQGGTSEAVRYTMQVRASFGLAALGGALIATSAALLLRRLIVRRKMRRVGDHAETSFPLRQVRIRPLSLMISF